MYFSTGTYLNALVAVPHKVHPVTFAPSVHSAFLLRSARGTLFSGPVSQRVLTDAHRHPFPLAMLEFKLETTIYGGTEGPGHTTCFVFCTHAPQALFLYPKRVRFVTRLSRKCPLHCVVNGLFFSKR